MELTYLQKRRLVLNEMKLERGCADCGYNAHPAALVWDHLGDKHNDKSAARHAFALSWNWQRILDEIAKCEVVCANCHAIRCAQRGYAGGRPMHGRKRDPGPPQKHNR